MKNVITFGDRDRGGVTPEVAVCVSDNGKVPASNAGDAHFGVCPICHRTNGFLNDGRDHWFVCETHMMKWHVGNNLFSSWRELTDEQRFVQRDALTRYRAVEPFRPEPHKPNALPCLSLAAVLPDGTEVRIAKDACCPYCGEKVPNFPEETTHGWRLLCPNHHDFIVAERR
jgi:hypothetical protein